jgi:hypothetical protein
MELEPRRVRVFFYGTFMNPAVLAEYGIVAKDLLPARVAGFVPDSSLANENGHLLLTLRSRSIRLADANFSVPLF